MEPYRLEQYQPTIPLNTLLDEIDQIPSNDDGRRSAFWGDVQNEIQNFENYSNTAYAMIGTKLWSVIRQFATPQPNLDAIENLADSLAEVIVELNDAIGENFKSYYELKHKFDISGGKESKANEFAQHLIDNFKFCNMYFGDQMCMLSDIYASINKKKQIGLEASSSGRVKTQKFFVRYEDVTRVKLATFRNVPILRQGLLQGVRLAQDKPGRRYSGFAHLDNSYSNNGEGDAKKITSLYFDNDKLFHYHEKMFRKDGANQIRARWEGDNDELKCSLERKTESFALHDSTKEVIDIEFSQIGELAAGKLKARNIANLNKKGETASFVDGLQKHVIRRQLKPIVKAEYSRTIFQLENDSRIRIALDVGIEFSKESYEKGKRNKRDDFIFPVGVLEVKTTVPHPEWLKALLKGPLVIAAYKFNKFAHGTAKLYGLQTKVLPPWFNRAMVHLRGYPSKQWYRQTIDTDQGFSLNAGGSAPKKSKKSSASASLLLLDDTSSSEDDQRVVEKTSWGRSPSIAKPPAKKSTNLVPLDKISEEVKPVPVQNVPSVVPAAGPIWGQGGYQKLQEPQQTGFLGKISALWNKITGKKAEGDLSGQTVRVEPKTFFANERTLLQWLNVAILLAIGGSAFLTFATTAPRFIGVGILVFALLFALYALGVYHYRRNAVVSRTIDGHYDDAYGPTVLVIMLFVYLICAVAFTLAYPIGGVIVGPVIVRDYRIGISTASLSSGDPEALLGNILNDIKNQLSDWRYTGLLNQRLGVMNVSYYDTQSCVFRNNGYRLRDIIGYDATGTLLSTTTKFEYRSDDGQFAARLDATYPFAGFFASEYVVPPYHFQYGRELNTTLPIANLLQIGAVADEFNKFYLWDNLNELNHGESLLKVNNLDLQLVRYGTVQIPFGPDGKIAEMTAQLWFYNSGTPVYGELSIAQFVQPGEILSKADLQDSKRFFVGIQNLASLNPDPVDPTDYFYTIAPFCTDFVFN